MHNDKAIKSEEKRLYNEYKKHVASLKKIQKERNSMGQVFTKGLLPIYTLYILSIKPSNGDDLAKRIGEQTKGLWFPSTGCIYPLFKKLERQGFIIGSWDNDEKKIQKIYSLTPEGFKELEEKKYLLKPKIKEALEIFKIIYSHLYN